MWLRTVARRHWDCRALAAKLLGLCVVWQRIYQILQVKLKMCFFLWLEKKGELFEYIKYDAVQGRAWNCVVQLAKRGFLGGSACWQPQELHRKESKPCDFRGQGPDHDDSAEEAPQISAVWKWDMLGSSGSSGSSGSCCLLPCFMDVSVGPQRFLVEVTFGSGWSGTWTSKKHRKWWKSWRSDRSHWLTMARVVTAQVVPSGN